MTKQYEPCEHRHEYSEIGSEEPVYYDTPCEKCEAEKDDGKTTLGEFIAIAVCVLAIDLLVTWRFA